jgi:hypothetical protein
LRNILGACWIWQRRRQAMRFRRRSEKAEALRMVPLLENLSKRELEQISTIADEVESEPGEVLMRQGGICRELILIVDGSVRIERNGKVIARRGGVESLQVHHCSLVYAHNRVEAVHPQLPKLGVMGDSRWNEAGSR